MLIYGLGLLGRKALRAIGINLSRYPSGGPYKVLLGLVARHDGPYISGPPRQVVLNESTNIRVL